MESVVCKKRQVDEGVASNSNLKEKEKCRGRCGCLRTSDKLREILNTFPPPPPPSPVTCDNACTVAYCPLVQSPIIPQMLTMNDVVKQNTQPVYEDKQVRSRYWQVVFDLVQLLQLSVTATALALYYLIYCYMQLVYYTLRSALYFHQADGPMKVTIAVLTVTSLVVGFNLFVRLEKLIWIV